ncbi:MAG: hypothetical protein IJ604_07255 [Prevotella sp.]|nr:hypothetical protein [Prevotella sp.]
MKVIEQKIQGKKTAETCEDGMVVTDSFVAVIDGSTSKSNVQLHPDMRNGQYAMMLICRYLKTIPSDITCKDFCEGITSVFQETYREHGISFKELQENPVERLTASAIVYSKYRKEIWMIGDCQCLVDGVHHDNEKPAEAVNAMKRSRYIHEKLKQGAKVSDFQTHDTGREYILHDIIDSCKSQNITYAVIDGFPVFMGGVKVISARNCHEIVLATDGYPRLLPTLSESEEWLQSTLESDPLCIDIHVATKAVMKGNNSFDDRTYIRFTDTE